MEVNWLDVREGAKLAYQLPLLQSNCLLVCREGSTRAPGRSWMSQHLRRVKDCNDLISLGIGHVFGVGGVAEAWVCSELLNAPLIYAVAPTSAPYQPFRSRVSEAEACPSRGCA